MDIASLGISVDSDPVKEASQRLGELASSAQRTENTVAKMAEQIGEGGKGIEGAMTRASVKGNLMADAIEMGIQRAVDAVKAFHRLISDAGAWQDLADMTGASAEGFASMKSAMDISGMSADAVATSMGQMTRMLSQVDDESKGAGKALAALGINMKDFENLRPDQRMREAAKAMAGYEDSAEKAAIAQSLFGRGGAPMLKLLKELGQETEINTYLTNEQIAAADEYSDANARLQSRLGQLMQVVALEAMPVMNAFMRALGDTVMQTLGLEEGSTKLGANDGVKIFATNAAKFLGGLITAGQYVARTFEHIAVRLAALDQVMGAIQEGKFSKVPEILKQTDAATKEIWSRKTFSQNLNAQLKEIENGEKKMAGAMETGALKRLETFKRGESQLDKERDKAAKAAARRADQEAKRRERELERLAKVEAKAREKEADEIMKEGRKKFLDDYDDWKKQQEEQQRFLDDTIRKEGERAIESHKAAAAIHEQAQAMEDQVANHGKLKSQIMEVTLAMMENELQAERSNDGDVAGVERRIEAYKRLIAAQRNVEAMEATEKAAKAAVETWSRSFDQISQSLTDAIIDGGVTGKQLVERMFKAMVLRPTLQLGMSAIGGLLGMGGGGGMAGSAAGGTGGIFSQLGGITSLLGGSFGIGASAGFGALGGGIAGITEALVAGGQLVGSGAVMGGLGMIAGVLGPIAIGVYGLYKLFGGKKGGPKVGGAVGENIGIGRTDQQDAGINQMLTSTVTNMNRTFDTLTKAFGVSNAGISFALGISTDPRGTAPSFVHAGANRDGQAIARSVNQDVGRTEEDLKRAIAEQTVDVMVTALRQSGIDQAYLDYFDKISAGLSGEAKMGALEQVAIIGQVVKSMEDMGPAFARVSAMSITAKIRLMELAGGAEQLAQGMAVYAENFLSEEEKRANTIRMITKTLQSAGLTINEQQVANATRDQFRAVVESLDMMSEPGQKAFVALMQVAGAFAQLTEVVDDGHAKRLSKAQQDLNDAYDQQKDVIENIKTSMESWMESLKNFKGDLLLSDLSPLSPEEKYAQAAAQYEMTKAQAKAGDLGAADRFDEVARAFLEASRDVFASSEQYQNDFMRVLGDTDTMLSVAELQYDTAVKSLTALDKSVEHLMDIKNEVISVQQAINNLAGLGFTSKSSTPHGAGLDYVPRNMYPATLHVGEAVLTKEENVAYRSQEELTAEIRRLRIAVETLQRSNREDAGAIIDATYDSNSQNAETISNATVEAAAVTAYAQKTKSILS